jgi:DNA (cytosine-5)-methyltransferase 1
VAGAGGAATAVPGKAAQRGDPPAADTASRRRLQGQPEPARFQGRPDTPVRGAPDPEAAGVEWGPYGPAIHRWETILGRSAPAPTETGTRGQPRLSARVVEWMMGLPAGWVTDMPLSRTAQMRLLGNGVVPLQAVVAFRELDEILRSGKPG